MRIKICFFNESLLNDLHLELEFTLIKHPILNIYYKIDKINYDKKYIVKFTKRSSEEINEYIMDDKNKDEVYFLHNFLDEDFRDYFNESNIENFITHFYDGNIDNSSFEEKFVLIRLGLFYDELVYDPIPEIRSKIAMKGYGLNYLYDDKKTEVRAEVAYNGYRLDELIKDEYICVRYAVAKQGYGLDKLIHDEKFSVREVCEKILNDEDSEFVSYKNRKKE